MTTNSEAGPLLAFTLADRLRKAREMKGLNKIEFADELGISRNSINRYEAGKGVPKRPTLVSWALSTGVPLQWLETGQLPIDPDGRRTSVSYPDWLRAAA